jgi:Na+/proline symporter
VGFETRRSAASALADAGAADAIGERVFLAADSTVQSVRAEALAMATTVTGEPSRDVNYVMPNFVLNHLPLGMAGIFIAAVMAAAMSSIAAELNSLSTATVIDFYRRWLRPDATDAHFLGVSKLATGFWGLFACIVAIQAGSLGSLIEVVNRFGSFFYGSILGVFLLAMIPRARAVGAFWGLIAGMTAVASVSFGLPQVAFLWHNVVGAVTVVVVGMLLSLGSDKPGMVNRESGIAPLGPRTSEL